VWSAICPWCATKFEAPDTWSPAQVREWVVENHWPIHVQQMADDQKPRCSRCHRYEDGGVTADHPLHRRCFDTECFCACSRTLAPKEG